MRSVKVLLLSVLLAALAYDATAVSLSDLIISDSDTIMLRGKNKRKVKAKKAAEEKAKADADAAAKAKAEADAAAKAKAEADAAAKAREEAEKKAAAEKAAAEERAKEAAAKAHAEAEAREAAEANARKEEAARLKALEEERARAEAEAKAKAAKERQDAMDELRKAQEALAAVNAKLAEANRKLEGKDAEVANAKAQLTEANRKLDSKSEEVAAANAKLKETEAQGRKIAKELQNERSATEAAEAKARAANAAVEAERDAAKKAVEAKAVAEARVRYLLNPDPDERAQSADVAKKDATVANPSVTPEPVVKHTVMPVTKKTLTGRDAIITAERTDYDRKEGVIFFDRNVYVDDEQYQMHADKLFVFLEGTNELHRLVAIGNVSITNDLKTASCAKAQYIKKVGKIVMFGDGKGGKAVLADHSPKGSTVVGDRITFWTNSEQVEVENPAIAISSGAIKSKDAKSMLKGDK